MSGRLRTIIASASALLQLSSASPADPTITAPAVLPRQNSDNFVGWVEVNNRWTSLHCESHNLQSFTSLTRLGDPGLTWYQSGQYAQCCPETLTHCYAAFACVGGSQIYTYPDLSQSVSTIACTEDYNNTRLSICNTVFIYENTQDSNPRTNINCGDSSVNWSYYREIPPEATATTSSIPGAIPSAPETLANEFEQEPSSKVWIAGAVVGPVLGLALVGAGIWLFLRRRKKAVQPPQYGTASMAPIDPNQPPTGVGGYTNAKPRFHPAQPTYYNRPGQPDAYEQQGYPQQGEFSPAPQYGFQSAYNATAGHTRKTKYEGVGGAAELSGDGSGISLGAAPVFELSGVNANRSGKGTADNDKPQ